MMTIIGAQPKKIRDKVLSYLQANATDMITEETPNRFTLITVPPKLEAYLQSFPSLPDSSPV